MNGRWFWFVILLGVLAVSYTVLTRRDANDNGAQAARPAQSGYYLEDAVIIETGPDGKPRIKLAARGIAQNARDNSIALSDVRVDYTAAPARHWALTAKEGHVPAGSQRIRFAGDVQIQDTTAANAPRVTTDTLELDVQKNIAHTESPVQIAFGPHRLSARGLWADLKGEKLRLESQVNGNFSSK